MWHSTYTVGFDGTYRFHNTTGKQGTVSFSFPFPALNATYDDLQIVVNGKTEPLINGTKGASLSRPMKPDEAVELKVALPVLTGWTSGATALQTSRKGPSR